MAKKGIGPDVLRWLDEDDTRTAEDAAAHFGCSARSVRVWRHRARKDPEWARAAQPPPATVAVAAAGPMVPAPVPAGTDWATLSDVEYWQEAIRLHHRLAEGAAGIAQKDHLRLAHDARKALREVMPTEQIRIPTKDEREAALRQMDDLWLEEAALELAMRHRARFLLVTDQMRAELQPDGTWRTE